MMDEGKLRIIMNLMKKLETLILVLNPHSSLEKKKKKKNLLLCYKLINKAMKYKEYCTNTYTEIHRTRETQIYVVHPIWAMSIDKQPILPFILSSKMKRYNLQQIHCNFLFSLTQCPLSLFLRIIIHNCNTIPSYKQSVSF